MTDLALGIDLGTSGIRTAVLDVSGELISGARAQYPSNDLHHVDAEAWWQGVEQCLAAQVAALRAEGIDPASITRIGVDGTSGSMVLTDVGLRPVTRALMYNDGGFDAEAVQIQRHAPCGHITAGSNSALARALRLIAEDTEGEATHLLHQADFIAARLAGSGACSDYNNCLKTGFDPGTDAWPAWFSEFSRLIDLLPKVLPAGTPVRQISSRLADRLGLARAAVIHVGTTDSIAAFLAAAPMIFGNAVTSLGTTLAVKILSDRRIDDPSIGLYSHRVGDGWLVGGASNTGGGVLAQFFSPEQIARLSDQIDPHAKTDLAYYPLTKPGERFPINDSQKQPELCPRPENDADFLHGLFDGMARIEARCYDAIEQRGGLRPTCLFTAGGGAKNAVWTAIREKHLKMPITPAKTTEAAIGTARLISQNRGGPLPA